MQITFIGDPRSRDGMFMSRHKGWNANDPAEVVMYGMTFKRGETVSVPDGSEWVRQWGARMRGNTHFQIEADPAPAANPLDHDGDGKAGGSLPAAERGLDDLRAEADALGLVVDARWGEKRLMKEIAAAKASA